MRASPLCDGAPGRGRRPPNRATEGPGGRFTIDLVNLPPATPARARDVELEHGATVTFSLEEAHDPDGDAVLHDVEVYVGGSLLTRTDAAAASDGTLALDVTLSVAGEGSWRARGRDEGGPGPWSEAQFSVRPPPAADAGPALEDAGPAVSEDAGPDPAGDAGVVTSAGDPKAPVVTRVREDPPTLSGGCTCGGSSMSDSGLAFALLFALSLLGRRRRQG